MGSSDERNSKAIDASVGGLVWVRRRNGSWWPGRIMAHHEVPDTSVVSPKSGTPIKLLGRDDASVDWYNLEKSKRVKAFRCGEYDACIDKAKATASATSKKAVKYARREDAIVHALEIENAHLAKDNPDGLSTEKAGEDSRTGDASHSCKPLKKNSKGKAAKAQAAQHVSVKRRKTPNDSEDDGTEGNKRMRGLKDIGMGMGSKVQVQQAGSPLHEENGFKSDVNNGSSSRDSSPSVKRRRSPVVNANEYPKRKDRRRPLTKVLESTTAMVSVPVSSDCLPLSGFSESKDLCEDVTVSLNASGNFVEGIDNKAKESETPTRSALAKDVSSTELFDVPLTGEEKHSAGVSSPTKALVSELTVPCGQQISQDDVMENEGCNGSASTSTLLNGIESASKWQLKGKRNSRQMSKKQEERRNAYAEDQRPYDRVGLGTRDMGRNPQLYDVKIEVKANYKPRSVPLISLRSKMNGKAIVGHPLTIEVVEDGSCDRTASRHIKSPGVVGDANTFVQVPPKPLAKKKLKKRKPHTKKSPSLSKKTRCLSTLSGQKKLTVVSKKKVVVTEKAKEQVVACIPLKVVFSRINEAVNGSVRQVHRALPSSSGNA